MKSNAVATFISLLLLAVGCSSSKNLGSSSVQTNCTETGTCLFSANLMNDTFERDHLLVNSAPDSDDINFWWRKVMSTNGSVISGKAGELTSAQILKPEQLVSGTGTNSALFLFGGTSASEEEFYLLSQTYDLRDAFKVEFHFSYLALDLEAGDLLSLDVCEDTQEACGSGETINVSGLNSTSWKSIWQLTGPSGTRKDGTEIDPADWKKERFTFDLNTENLNAFSFRIRVRLNEGVNSTNLSFSFADAVGLDDFKVIAFKEAPNADGSAALTPIPGFVNPFDPRQAFDLKNPALFE